MLFPGKKCCGEYPTDRERPRQRRRFRLRERLLHPNRKATG
jgi:hypothetical protein